MTRRLRLEGVEYQLAIERRNGQFGFDLQPVDADAAPDRGEADIRRVAPNVFSVLIAHRSFLVRVADRDGAVEVAIGDGRYLVELDDPRDRRASASGASLAGPQQLVAQMPGKVVQVLVCEGDSVEAGQGVIIVEAMKMQNEMRSPKQGRVAKLLVNDGAAVAAGEALLVIE